MEVAIRWTYRIPGQLACDLGAAVFSVTSAAESRRPLAEAIPGYFDRVAVLPGITGLAQINLPPDSDISSVRRKLVPAPEKSRR